MSLTSVGETSGEIFETVKEVTVMVLSTVLVRKTLDAEMK